MIKKPVRKPAIKKTAKKPAVKKTTKFIAVKDGTTVTLKCGAKLVVGHIPDYPGGIVSVKIVDPMGKPVTTPDGGCHGEATIYAQVDGLPKIIALLQRIQKTIEKRPIPSWMR